MSAHDQITPDQAISRHDSSSGVRRQTLPEHDSLTRSMGTCIRQNISLAREGTLGWLPCINRVPRPSQHQRGWPEEGEPIYGVGEGGDGDVFLEAAAAANGRQNNVLLDVAAVLLFEKILRRNILPQFYTSFASHFLTGNFGPSNIIWQGKNCFELFTWNKLCPWFRTTANEAIWNS
jgi:hypothetical protein